jgi:hypothetical protein
MISKYLQKPGARPRKGSGPDREWLIPPEATGIADADAAKVTSPPNPGTDQGFWPTVKERGSGMSRGNSSTKPNSKYCIFAARIVVNRTSAP